MSDAITAMTLQGRAQVQSAWRAALLDLQAAASARTAVITCIDSDFSHWPLSEPAVLHSLTQWLRTPGRQLRLLALDFAVTARTQPGFARWRRDWGHALSCASPPEPLRRSWPSLLLTGTVAVELLDAAQWRGRVQSAPAVLQAWIHEADAFAQRCEPAWPVTTLGL